MKLAILDRDGVINVDSDAFIKSADEWIPLPGSLDAIARLHRAGWRVFVATNQSGLARGLFDVEALTAIHTKMNRMIADAGGALAGVIYCPHAPDGGCECRKPAPGMYREIAERLGCSLTDIPVIGDSARDLEAATTVGARPILVLTGKGTETLAADPALARGEVYADLEEAVEALLEEDTRW
ncbi:MAG: D-glycero-beta-D-manno-heptose 1,7-bisphosphate 7-phosphatase [Xanthomonadaceae bacterium]|nr:D-glycero-beta-D-manno-heptose 1,7-bisphosphate 7-phosphatase [Xanthomonadaceae bacterium]